MDARGYQRVPDVGVIALINLNDVFSRVKLLSYPCWSGQKRVSRHPTTEDYQLVWIHQEVEITFDCQHQQLLFRSADGEQTKRL